MVGHRKDVPRSGAGAGPNGGTSSGGYNASGAKPGAQHSSFTPSGAGGANDKARGNSGGHAQGQPSEYASNAK